MGRTGGGAGGGSGDGAGGGSGGSETYFDASSITVRTGDVPIFFWPRLKGRVDDIPLRSVTMGTRDNDGFRIETAWDLYSLLGMEGAKGTDLELHLDGYTKRGGGAGIVFDYDLANSRGTIDAYGMYDDGTDKTSTGREVDQDDEIRGVALLEHHTRLTRHLSFQAQTSYISDETFISTWREDDYEERREYETSAFLKYQKDRTALTLLTKYDVNDFISNGWLLASQPYTVERLPEITYRNYGIDWFKTLTYTGELRASRMRLSFQESTPAEAGVRGRAFGIGDDDPIDDLLRSNGLRQRYVFRLDSRHEIAWPTKFGFLDVTPFVVGRSTLYGNDFDEYSSDSDSRRLFGAAGLRLNAQFQYVDNSVENRILDLHRLRHIIEPSVTLWFGAADVDQEDLPVYDLAVESLATGAAMRVGMRNTWQTQRGGPGRWRSVDVLTLNTDLVLTSSDTDRESPTPQFFDYRPEYSQMGDHVHNSMIWILSDAFSVVGEATVDLDESAVARGSIGCELRHSPDLSTYVEYRYIDASDNQLLGVGWRYRLTKKYMLALRPQWDFREDEFRSVDVRVTRSFPEFDLTVQVKRDEIRDETSFGASIGFVEF
jgi:hypothetical protein